MTKLQFDMDHTVSSIPYGPFSYSKNYYGDIIINILSYYKSMKKVLSDKKSTYLNFALHKVTLS